MPQQENENEIQARIRTAVEAERQACIRIAEEHLRQLQHGHGVHGERVITSLIHALEARDSESPGGPAVH